MDDQPHQSYNHSLHTTYSQFGSYLHVRSNFSTARRSSTASQHQPARKPKMGTKKKANERRNTVGATQSRRCDVAIQNPAKSAPSDQNALETFSPLTPSDVIQLPAPQQPEPYLTCGGGYSTAAPRRHARRPRQTWSGPPPGTRSTASRRSAPCSASSAAAGCAPQ